MTDEEIIAGCKQGKPSYQEALYQKYARKMMGICIRYTSSRPEAEDVFQDAYVKVFKNLELYQGGSFEGWIRRIFVNTAISNYHKNKKYTKVADIEETYNHESGTIDILSEITEHELLNLVNQLPDGYKLVFNLYVIEGYSHAEIAALLNVSEGTSKSQLSKAKNHLRKMILKFYPMIYATR